MAVPPLVHFETKKAGGRTNIVDKAEHYVQITWPSRSPAQIGAKRPSSLLGTPKTSRLQRGPY